jgi:peroxiredoxin
MYPHERSLVEKLKNKPFAIVGVNSDGDKAGLREAMKKENITWRSFFDGGSTHGPIATEWNVSGWPTIYVIDAAGRIRFKNVRGPQLEAAIDALLAELESGRPAAK